MYINGMFIHVDALCLEETNEPVMEHKLKPRMKLSYHNRIQKKWNKRFGFVKKPAMFKVGNKIVCHPTIAEQIKHHFKDMRNMNGPFQSIIGR